MPDLLERIMAVRHRTAEELPHLSALAIECINAVEAEAPEKGTVKTKDRTYVILRTGRGKAQTIARPFRRDLFISDPAEIRKNTARVCRGRWNRESAHDLEKLVYTFQQAISVYLDLLHPTGARRIVGTFFEAVIACALNRVSGLTVGSGTVRIPELDETIRTDLGVIRKDQVVLLAATKTSTRERLSQPFVQKRILEQALKNPPKSILIVVGDVQRTGDTGVQHTFTAGQFLLYWKYLTPLDGVFYIDVPPQAETRAFGGRVKRLWELFDTGLPQLLAQ